MNYLYFQSLIQYRVPINDDGTAGQPEVTKKFTSEIFAKPKKIKENVQLQSDAPIEEEW